MTRHTFSSLADTATWPNSLFQLPRSEVRESQGASSSPARGAQPRFGPGPSDAPPRLVGVPAGRFRRLWLPRSLSAGRACPASSHTFRLGRLGRLASGSAARRLGPRFVSPARRALLQQVAGVGGPERGRAAGVPPASRARAVPAAGPLPGHSRAARRQSRVRERPRARPRDPGGRRSRARDCQLATFASHSGPPALGDAAPPWGVRCPTVAGALAAPHSSHPRTPLPARSSAHLPGSGRTLRSAPGGWPVTQQAWGLRRLRDRQPLGSHACALPGARSGAEGEQQVLLQPGSQQLLLQGGV